MEKHTKLLADKINEGLIKAKTMKQQLELSFDAHFDFVTIHSFYDGNGRRLAGC